MRMGCATRGDGWLVIRFSERFFDNGATSLCLRGAASRSPGNEAVFLLLLSRERFLWRSVRRPVLDFFASNVRKRRAGRSLRRPSEPSSPCGDTTHPPSAHLICCSNTWVHTAQRLTKEWNGRYLIPALTRGHSSFILAISIQRGGRSGT